MNTIGIKKTKAIYSMGSKFNRGSQSIGNKFNPVHHYNLTTPPNNFKNGIVNDSNGTAQAREVIKGIYNQHKPVYNSIEKHRKHKRNNFN